MAGKISEMTTTSTLNESDLFETAQVSPGSPGGFASFKVTLNTIALKILTGITFNVFGNKTVSNAVNDKTNISAIADIYDNTATYAVGDYVMYQGALYKCITAVETAEDFDSSKWQGGTVSDFFSSGSGGGGSGSVDIYITTGVTVEEVV